MSLDPDEIRRMIADNLGVDADDIHALDRNNPSPEIMAHIKDITGVDCNTNYGAVHTEARAAAIALADELWEVHLAQRDDDPSLPADATVEDDAARAFVMKHADDTLMAWGVDEQLWRIITDFTALHQMLIDAVIEDFTDTLQRTLAAKSISNSAEEDFDAAISDFLGGQS